MTTLADKSLLSRGDNKLPMLEKHLYDSWKSRMELYMMNRPHGRMILASIEKGPLVWPLITEDGVTRLKEYVEVTPAEAIQADCDIKAINIILQGLPTEIYALLYDEFDKFTYKRAGGKLCDINAEESWALLEDLTLYDNESWNDLRNFSKPVKVITLPQDVPSTSGRCLIELENQVQRLMEAHLALTQPTQVNKITSSFVYTKGDDGDVMFIEIVKKNDESHKEEPEVGGLEVEYSNIFST
ncbi:hypothetical protein Tco_0802796 [Tanacetum coccineum]|uniref:Uncharacterized protein n=1 Tax=Tanacetum coccineum TaxID=301880 RepID=A0ABQ5A469_9ASTR